MPLDTLANVKTSMRVSGTTDDALLTRLMDAADDFIATHTGRAFAGGTFTETHPAGREFIFMRNFPVTAVTSLRVDANRVFGPETTRSAETYVLHVNCGVIECLNGPFLPPRDGRRDDWPEAVQVIYTTATSAVPAAVKEAFSQLVGHWYRLAKTFSDQDYQMLIERVDINGTKGWPWSLAPGEKLPRGVLQLLQPYRVPSV